MPHGIDEGEWHAAVSAITSILVGLAKQQELLITYGELCAQIRGIVYSVVPIKPDDWHFHRMLDEISIAEDDAGRGMLSALVVHGPNSGGERAGRPGPGFFALAIKRGREGDPDTIWIKELEKVRAAHQGR